MQKCFIGLCRKKEMQIHTDIQESDNRKPNEDMGP